MPSAKPTESKTRHAVLGPGTAIYDNRARTGLRLVLWVLLVALGIYGVWRGGADVASGSTVTGAAQALGGVIVAAYSVWAVVMDARRMASPIRLVIARDGFALLPGTGTVSWNEVESVGDPRSPYGQPRTLRVQLADPDEFRERHALSPVARLRLMFDRGDLLLGSGLAIPIPRAEDLMRKALADFGGTGSGRTAVPVRARESKARRSRRRSG